MSKPEGFNNAYFCRRTEKGCLAQTCWWGRDCGKLGKLMQKKWYLGRGQVKIRGWG